LRLFKVSFIDIINYYTKLNKQPIGVYPQIYLALGALFGLKIHLLAINLFFACQRKRILLVRHLSLFIFLIFIALTFCGVTTSYAQVKNKSFTKQNTSPKNSGVAIDEKDDVIAIPMAGSLGGVSPLDGVEWQVDMPWRMEPSVITEQVNAPVNTMSMAKVGAFPQKRNKGKGSNESNKRVTYGPIPITFTINDVAQRSSFTPSGAEPNVALKRFCGMYVVEFQPGKSQPESIVTFIPPNMFYEIEASKAWNNIGELPLPHSESHQVKRMWNGDSPEDLLNIEDWAEWNGTAYYKPVSGAPKGKDLRIIAAARISTSASCSNRNYKAENIVNKLRRGSDFKDGHLARLVSVELESYQICNNSNTPQEGCITSSEYIALQKAAYEKFEKNFAAKLHDEESVLFGDFLRTHYAAEPLPRFDGNWAYGDLHYHSQGTDNEGESGTSYRSALASMKALGLDYAFATDHASDSVQVTGVYLSFLEQIPGIHSTSDSLRNVPILNELSKKIEDLTEDYLVSTLKNNNVGVPLVDSHAIRDMSKKRFAHLLNWLQGANGANQEIFTRPGSKRLPQLFLGGEVDIIPEVSKEDSELGVYPFGAGESYRWKDACHGLPEVSANLDFAKRCLVEPLEVGGGIDGRVGLKDVQGILDRSFYARQHLVYLPKKIEPSNSDKDIFISSSTSEYGGATKHLYDVIEEAESNDLGYMFLAHPVSAAKGKGIFRLGPDIYPYSKAQLDVAFASPRILGLQLWNENARLHSKLNVDAMKPNKSHKRKYPFLHGTRIEADTNGKLTWGAIDWSWAAQTDGSLRFSLLSGSSMWDMVNLWGITPARTELIGLKKGKPRKFFMAGGSDAHGDFNYRREGAVIGWTSANDTTIGSPRNLTYIANQSFKPTLANGVQNSLPLKQNNVLDALKSGQFSVTDGPALRIAIDRNDNGKIDEQDLHMGQDASFTTAKTNNELVQIEQLSLSTKLKVIFEWKSTPEFGAVNNVKLVVGVQNGDHEGLVYQSSDPRFCLNTLIKDSAGRGYCPSKSIDYLVHDARGILEYSVPEEQGFNGKYVMELDTSNFRLFDKECKRLDGVLFAIPRPEFNENLDDLVNAPPPPTIPMTCIATNIKSPQRMFIRAQASTIDTKGPPAEERDRLLNRFAFTNPIWIRNIPHKSQTDEMSSEFVERCTKDSQTLCESKQASCSKVHGRNGSSSQVCRWKGLSNTDECKIAGGIWTVSNSKYAINHPDALLKGKSAACISDVKNLVCNAKDMKLCRNNNAMCESLNSVSGKQKKVCRWEAINNANACNRTAGIWTTNKSKYSRKHPNAVGLGKTGACITEVKNIRKRIN
jgi:hypothetical protein